MRRNGRRSAIPGKWCWTRINDSDEIRARRYSGQRIASVAVFLIELFIENGRGRSQLRSCGEPHDADLIRIEIEILGIRAHQSNRLESVIHGIDLWIVPIASQPIPKYHRVDTIVVKEGHEVCALGSDVERVVPSASHQDHRSPGIQPAIDHMKFDGWVVDVDNAGNSAGYRLAHVVLFGLTNAIRFQEGRARMVEG